MSKMRLKKGQSIIEYSVVVVCIITAFVAAQYYLRRAFQGRLRSAADQIGEQYDPQAATGGIETTVSQDVLTEVFTDYPITVDGKDGHGTYRKETINEYKTEREGTETMGPY